MRIQVGQEVRDATSEEIAAYEAAMNAATMTQANIEKVSQERVSALAKLAALGLTEAEVSALIGA